MSTRNYTDEPMSSQETTAVVATPTDASSLVITDPSKNTTVGFDYGRAMDLMPTDMKSKLLEKAKKHIDLVSMKTQR